MNANTVKIAPRPGHHGMIDVIDRKIISELKKNGRMNWGQLAEIVGISRQALKKRTDRLERRRHILGYTIVTSHEDAEKSSHEDSGVQAFLKVRFSKGNDCGKLSHTLPSYRNVVASWSIAGDWDAVILVRAGTMEKISEIRDIIVRTGGIDSIKTDVILTTLHSNGPV